MCDQRNHQSWLVLLAAWATFLLFGAIAAPVPGVNEPHYLCKARHYWQPEWCPRDFFLASPNAHTVFYATIGSLTNFCSFDMSAWIGRAMATFILAWGWTRCLSRLFSQPWTTLWCAWIFLAMTACGNFSGEWLVGGVEGKVFAYGFLLAALGSFLRGVRRLAATWAGIAVSFHPVVGIWGLLAFAMSRITRLFFEFRRANRVASVARVFNEGTGSGRVPTGSTAFRVFSRPLFQFDNVQSALIVFVLALPGLIPVIRLLTEQVSEDTRYEATYIQVYFRLAHHLDPMLFPASAYLGYTVLLCIWVSNFFWGGRTESRNAFDQIVIWAVVFAIGGIMIGFGPRPPVRMPYFAERMNLLKFYPFRLADVLVPIAVAISLTSVLERTFLTLPPTTKRRSTVPFPVVVMVFVFLGGLCRAYAMSETNRYSHEDRKDWLDICRWIDEHLPADALVESPTNCWAFKWFARRAEYVAFKDCPQDAAGIVEWNRRLMFLKKWYDEKYSDQFYSATELKDLRQQTGLTHLLTDRLGPLELEPIYRNGTFHVYDLSVLE
jgi:hypothetical protein